MESRTSYKEKYCTKKICVVCGKEYLVPNRVKSKVINLVNVRPISSVTCSKNCSKINTRLRK